MCQHFNLSKYCIATKARSMADSASVVLLYSLPGYIYDKKYLKSGTELLSGRKRSSTLDKLFRRRSFKKQTGKWENVINCLQLLIEKRKFVVVFFFCRKVL